MSRPKCNLCGDEVGIEYYEIEGETYCERCVSDCHKSVFDYTDDLELATDDYTERWGFEGEN